MIRDDVWCKLVNYCHYRWCQLVNVRGCVNWCNDLSMRLMCDKCKSSMFGPKIDPKMAKKRPLFDFFDFCKKCPYDSNETFYSHFLHHSMGLCVQFQLIRLTGIGASQKEKDLSRLLHLICGSGFTSC